MAIIAVLNLSTDLSDSEAALAVKAVAKQLRDHVAPAWEREGMAVEFFRDATAIPDESHVVAIFNTGEDAAGLGYHNSDPNGNPYGKVFSRAVLDHGGEVLSGGTVTVSMVLSHEVIEMFLDPGLRLWVTDAEGTQWAVEACDPVQFDRYQISVDGTDVAVSNFVLPTWWDRTPPEGAKFDFLGTVPSPYSLTPPGYCVYRKGGIVQKQLGPEFPDWLKEVKQHPAARTARRVGD